MNRLEDGLRDAFGAAAETLQPDSMAGLPDSSREPRRSPGTGLRRLTPLGAAIAVAVIIAAASVITPLALSGHQHPAPSASRHNPPPGHRPPSGHRPIARPVVEIKVPQVVGMQASRATAALLAAGLRAVATERADAAVSPDTVIAQNPAGGTHIRSGQTVILVVSNGPSVSPASTLPASSHTVTSQTYAVTISFPASWQPTPYLGPGRFGYDGASGWVRLDESTEPSGLRNACTATATGNVLHPYGLHPRIVYRSIDGRPGCLILPSPDAPRQPARAGGPAFQTSSALVEYRQPLRTYALLVIDADPAHLAGIADSANLHH